MPFINKKFKVSYPYPLGYPIKVVVRNWGKKALLGWLFQKYASNTKETEILISERIVELSLFHQWFGSHIKNRAQVLEIGHVASSVALELASLGYDVTGIDLREYSFRHKNLKSIKGDFLLHDFSDRYDLIYTLSTIEHFGFTERYDGKKDVDNNLDEQAFAKIAHLLKPQGKAIISVPYSKELVKSIWFRIFTRDSLSEKLSKHFDIVDSRFYKRQNNQWEQVSDPKDDPVQATDGVAILFLIKKG